MHNKTVRVLQVLGILNRGGAETMIMNLYRSIDREKVQFDFVVHTEVVGAYDSEVEALGGHIYHAPRYQGINHFEYVKWWYSFFAEHTEYNLIHSHIRSTASIFLPIAKRYGRKTVAHSHSTSNGRGIEAVAKGLLKHGIVHGADYLFACSDVAGQWLFGKKATKQKPYHILNNAIEIKRFSYDPKARERVRQEFGVRDAFLMGTVGRITPPKNPSGMLKIIKSVCDQCPDARFLWVGTGEQEDMVKAWVRADGLEKKVIFAGVRSDIPDLLSAMDVFVFPSLWEGLPVSVIEAQASGLPCLLSHAITEEVCITPVVSRIPVEDTEQWISEILAVYQNPARMDTADDIIKAGYDIETTAAWLQDFYLKQVCVQAAR